MADADPIACRDCGTPLDRLGDAWVHTEPDQGLHCPGWMRPTPATQAAAPVEPPPEPEGNPADEVTDDDRRPRWHRRAACLNEDPELFFPAALERWAPTSEEALAPARRVCATCPVSAECLRWALEAGADHGVWAGTTPSQRRRMRLERSRQ